MRRMTAAMFILAGALVPALASAQAYKVDKYNIGGEGGTDYLTSDPATGRVIWSAKTSGCTDWSGGRRPNYGNANWDGLFCVSPQTGGAWFILTSAAVMAIDVPSGVWVSALSTRIRRICATLSSSATATACPPLTSTTE